MRTVARRRLPFADLGSRQVQVATPRLQRLETCRSDDVPTRAAHRTATAVSGAPDAVATRRRTLKGRPARAGALEIPRPTSAYRTGEAGGVGSPVESDGGGGGGGCCGAGGGGAGAGGGGDGDGGGAGEGGGDGGGDGEGGGGGGGGGVGDGEGGGGGGGGVGPGSTRK
jgi:hypothetical protein